MLLIAHHPADVLVEALTPSGLPASVGPTSDGGWTAVWTDAEQAYEALSALGGPLLAVDEGRSGPVVRLEGAGSGDVAARVCAAFGRPGAQPEVAALLDGADDAEALLDGLSGLLPMPQLDDGLGAVGVVAHRGERASARLAAGVVGPARLRELGAWTALVPAGDGGDRTPRDRALQLAAGLSGTSRRRDGVLLLWRDGVACGWSVWRKGRPDAGWAWNSRWRAVGPGSGDVEEQGEAARLLGRATGGDVDEVALRALLRRDPHPGDPLTELAGLLDLPAGLLDLLDDEAAVQDAELVPRGAAGAVLRSARTGVGTDAPPALRALSTAYAAFTVLAAAACVLLLVLAVAVLVTDGAAVDHDGTTGEDWQLLPLLGVLSLVLVPTAVWRVRRVRRRWAAADGRPPATAEPPVCR